MSNRITAKRYTVHLWGRTFYVRYDPDGHYHDVVERVKPVPGERFSFYHNMTRLHRSKKPRPHRGYIAKVIDEADKLKTADK